MYWVRRVQVWVLVLLLVPSCATPTLVPYPDSLDIALVHDEVTMLINSIRTSHEVETLAWDEDLQGLAERRAWERRACPQWIAVVSCRCAGAKRCGNLKVANSSGSGTC